MSDSPHSSSTIFPVSNTRPCRTERRAINCLTMTPQQHPKLIHLSEEQLQALIDRYYNGSKTSDLVVEFGVDVRSSELFKLFAPKVLKDAVCPYCKINLWQNLRSKSSRCENAPFCPNCRHEPSEGTRRNCSCGNCRKKAADIQAAIQDTKFEIVRVAYPVNEQWKNPDVDYLAMQLTLRDAVFISALYRNANVDDLGTVGPPYAKDRPLAPTSELVKTILDGLGSRGMIRVSQTSPIDAFVFNAECTAVEAHYIFKVRYRLFPMLPVEMIAPMIRNIDDMATDGFWLQNSETSMNDALALWKELAVHECLEAFEHQGECHNLQPPSGEKTHLTFQALIDDYSVAQVYNIIWGAARNAAAYYQRGGVNKAQASNSMVGGCRTRGDKAKVEGWDIKPYSRNFDRPRSELSHVLHDVFLKIGERGFTQKPNRELLVPTYPRRSIDAT